MYILNVQRLAVLVAIKAKNENMDKNESANKDCMVAHC